MPNMKVYRVTRDDGTKVPMPKYSREGDACFDVYSANLENIVIPSRETVMIPSGLIIEPDAGYHVKLQNRSGMGTKHNIQLSHCTGVIDGNYRGEIMIPMYNRGRRAFIVEPNMRICQAEIVKDCIATITEVDSIEELSATERGSDGFGSSGTK